MDEAIFISQNRYTGAHNQGSQYSTESPSIEARSKPKVNSGESEREIDQPEGENQRGGTRLFDAGMFTRDPGRDRPALRLVTDDLGIGIW
ncbi:hypothetical protein N7465_007555 [Penicillium sp. CMV-2018d]|nr:hypothetical protein N7465_007555 [Penicillium sp. CMV-2018d]